MRRPCLTCGVLIERGSRCPEHEREERRRAEKGRDRAAHLALYNTDRWHKLSASLRARWVREYGPICPGWGPGVPEHVSSDLTVDHIIPTGKGGAPFDYENLTILCRTCNSRRGDRPLDRAVKPFPKARIVDLET